MLRHILILGMALGITVCAEAQAVHIDKTDRWKGFERLNFSISGHQAYVVKPEKPLLGNPWVWRASFPDWHTDADSLLLSKGVYLIYVNVDDQYGSPQAMQVWDQLYRELVATMGLSKRVALEAVSRGALYAYSWAKRNPDKVTCIYAEAPVCSIKSWPGGKGKGIGDGNAWAQLKQVYNFTEQQALTFADNPTDNLEGLAAFNVPILHLISKEDQVVPPDENTFLLAARYKALGGSIQVQIVSKQPQQLHGHHFDIEHPEALAEFILRNSYPVEQRLPYQNYFKLRSGLARTSYKLAKERTLTVAFLGGSITFNPGWREKVCRYLLERFPHTHFHFIGAGIPSLGSLPHAFRLQRDVLDSGRVDLMFLETAVNDHANNTDSLTQVRALEGIVRHALYSNPKMDIVMMSFADADKNNMYDKGKVPVEVTNHELIASHYQLPSINLAQEVHDKIKHREFDWNKDFKDLHPAPFGQELYFATLKDLLDGALCLQAADRPFHILSAPLDNSNFERGSYLDIHQALHDAGWQINEDWSPSDHLPTRPGFVQLPVLEAKEPGSTLTLAFSGKAIGIAVLSGQDSGRISYSIDGAAFREIELFTPWSQQLYLPWFILFDGNLKSGKHALKIKVSGEHHPLSKGTACRIVYFLRNQ
jgi:sialidase-1